MASDWITEENYGTGVRFTVRQDVFAHVKALLWIIGIFIGLVVVIAVLPNNNSAGVAKFVIALFLLLLAVAGFKMFIKALMFGLFVGKATVSFSVSEGGLTVHRASGRSRKHDGRTLELDRIDGPTATFADSAATAEAAVYINYAGQRIVLASLLINDQASYLHQQLCGAMGRDVVHNTSG